MNLLSQRIIDELNKINWESLTSVIDNRKWSIYCISKALWEYALDSYDLSLTVNGFFLNNTNYQQNPLSTPYYQSTNNIHVQGWIRLKSHKKLYDILSPWIKMSDDPKMVWVDFFQRIFNDWLNPLEIQVGQDSNTTLPLIPPPIFNSSPPYFHSINNSTLNKYTPPKYKESNRYPFNPEIIPATNTPQNTENHLQKSKQSQINKWNIEKQRTQIDIENLRLTWNQSDTALNQQVNAYRSQWDLKLKELRDELESLQTSNSDTQRQNNIISEIDNIHKSALDYDDNSYPKSIARLEMINHEIDLLNKDNNNTITITPIDTGKPHPNAPDLTIISTIEPTPIDYEYPENNSWYEQMPKIVFNNYEIHAIKCYNQLLTNEKLTRSISSVWEIVSEHIINCFNDHIKLTGGKYGYAYGMIENTWNGTINIHSIEWKK